VRREGFDVRYVDVVDRPRRHGVSNYGMWDRLWIGIVDLAGVFWLIRRRKRVPRYEEVTRAR
jgi:dolichol-phosphate mannosyltransferase